ncbi:MAG: hypothetical protein EZS28_047070, partial [Streblomastix strix]
MGKLRISRQKLPQFLDESFLLGPQQSQELYEELLKRLFKQIGENATLRLYLWLYGDGQVLHQQQEDWLLDQWFKLASVAVDNTPTANATINFNADDDPTAAAGRMTYGEQDYHPDEVLHYWLGFSTACRPFNQFAICKDNTKLWDPSIYAREQAVICSNLLNDLCTNNSVSVSPLESIIAGKRLSGIFIDVKMSDINAKSTTTEPFPNAKT